MENRLVIDGLSKSFAGVPAVSGVKAVILPGRVTAFIGPNGAGKTTLFHLLAGGLRPDSGRVLWNGSDITSLPPWRRARLGLGRLFQDVRVFGQLSVAENVLVALLESSEAERGSAIARVFRGAAFRERLREEVLQRLAAVDLEGQAAARAAELSFGQQKLLAFARLLASRPRIALLDEPTAALAPPMVDRLILVLKKEVEEHATTVAIIEHDMNAVARLADWVHFMHEGRVAFTGRMDHVLGNREVRETYVGL